MMLYVSQKKKKTLQMLLHLDEEPKGEKYKWRTQKQLREQKRI